ncbi:MAG: AMP-binding protein [Sphingobium sp.]|nr:AMP-binding protein [Sphingobium sp.]
MAAPKGEGGMYPANLSESLFPARQDQPLRNLTIGDALREAAARWPDAEALAEICGDGGIGRRWTFAALLADSERLARALLTRFHPGERICAWGPNTPEWVMLEFATAIAGLVLVTANPGLKAREIAYVLGQSGAVGLFAVREHRGNPLLAIAAEVARDLIALREVTDMEDPDALFAHAGPERPVPDVAPVDPVQIQYTSGTTGFPKGVTLHHNGLLNNSRHHFTLANIAPGDRMLLMLPLFHTGGCALGMLGGLQLGCCTFLLRQFDPQVALRIAQSEGIAAFLGVPTMLQAIAEVHEADPRPLPALHTVGSGGSMVPPELVRDITRRFDCTFVIVYGQTESSPLLTMTRHGDDRDKACETVGRPMPHLDLAIFDLATGGIAALGEQGEIRARGYALMLGYHENPEATAAAIDTDGWLHTGDIGTMDAEGFVRVTGRVKEMIIRGGENLFPAEIENVLLEHPDVAEVAVVGVPDQRLGEAVAAFVRPVPGRRMDEAALFAHCRGQMAAQKTPAHWIEVSEWPLTGSGKIQKFELRRQWEEARAVPA